MKGPRDEVTKGIQFGTQRDSGSIDTSSLQCSV